MTGHDDPVDGVAKRQNVQNILAGDVALCNVRPGQKHSLINSFECKAVKLNGLSNFLRYLLASRNWLKKLI